MKGRQDKTPNMAPKKDFSELDPLRHPSVELARLFIRIHPEIKKELEKRASKKDVSLNAMVNHALAKFCSSSED